MMKVNPLTESQLRQFQDEGYVILGRTMDDATLQGLRQEEARFREPVGGQERTIFRSQVNDYSQVVREFCLRGAHLPLLRQLIGPNVAFWFNQFVTKLPDGASGRSEFPWHQDNGYMAIEPATNVTIWFALDDVDERNGCVWVMPASHKQGLLDHRTASADSWHLTLKVEGDGVPAVLKAGEAVAFTGLTLHRSKLNHTDRPRRAFFTEYADAASRYRRPEQTQTPWQPVVGIPHTQLVHGQLEWTGVAPPLGY